MELSDAENTWRFRSDAAGDLHNVVLASAAPAKDST